MNIDWERLAELAWRARQNAHLYGSTAVGAVALAQGGKMYAACNVEHRFRSHDIHAEVNAIGSMVANGERRLIAILIVAERDRFTPCGACLDWIFEVGGPGCPVAFQNKPGAEFFVLQASELMPYYPS